MKMKNHFNLSVISMLISLIGFVSCKKKQEASLQPNPTVEPFVTPANLSNLDTAGCHQSLFSPCLLVYNGSDSIYSKDGILHFYTQNKPKAVYKIPSLSTYNHPIKGDFELEIYIEPDFSYSRDTTSRPGYYVLNLGNSAKTIQSVRHQEGTIWVVGTDTLRHIPGPILIGQETCSREVHYRISRQANTIVAKHYFCRDSLVKVIQDFGSQDLDLSFALSCDTSGQEYSSIKVTKLALKMSNGNVKSESFCGDRIFKTN